MALTSMKQSKSEREREFKPDPDDENYPWGLRLHLDEQTMEKLDLGELTAGQEVAIAAVAVVAIGGHAVAIGICIGAVRGAVRIPVITIACADWNTITV